MKMFDTDNEFVALCRSLPGAEEDVKWSNNLVFSVGNKMFAGFGMPDCKSLGFKTPEALFSSLVEQEGIRPHTFMARYFWVEVPDSDIVSAKLLRELLIESHRLVAEKLSAKKRKALGL